jgi:methylmalonyl-CoA mutase N-terminal domain/subunit
MEMTHIVRPDIYGKIGNAGVSICCLDDAKKLYSGFDLVIRYFGFYDY